MNLPDLIGGLIGFVLTLIVFSYLLGDNAMFRLVVYAFIGVSAGFITVVVVYNIIWPKLVLPILEAEGWQIVRASLPLILGLLLFARLFPRYSWLSSPVLAIVVGVGAATAIGGAIFGVLLPQSQASVNLFDLNAVKGVHGNSSQVFANASIVLLGTISSLVFFHFGIRIKAGAKPSRAPWLEWLAQLGKGFIVVAFGFIFAGVYATALAAMIERLSSLTRFVFSFFGG